MKNWFKKKKELSVYQTALKELRFGVRFDCKTDERIAVLEMLL